MDPISTHEKREISFRILPKAVQRWSFNSGSLFPSGIIVFQQEHADLPGSSCTAGIIILCNVHHLRDTIASLAMLDRTLRSPLPMVDHHGHLVRQLDTNNVPRLVVAVPRRQVLQS